MKILANGVFAVMLGIAALAGMAAVSVGIVEIIWRVYERFRQAWKLRHVPPPADEIRTAAVQFTEQTVRKTYVPVINTVSKSQPQQKKDPRVFLVRRDGERLLYFFGRNELRQESHFTPLKLFAAPLPKSVAERLQGEHDCIVPMDGLETAETSLQWLEG